MTESDGTTVLKLGWLRNIGALDFAGGTVVHITSGVSALVAGLIVGRRQGLDQKTHLPPHNIPFVLLGAALLWFGWFGFNSGSALLANGLAGTAFVNTQIAPGTAFVTWMILDCILCCRCLHSLRHC